MFTRKDYLAGTVSHDSYYAQFVNDATLRRIGLRFDANEISLLVSKDKHLNNVSMKVWDQLAWTPTDGKRQTEGHSGPFRAVLPFDREAINEAGEMVTRAVLVCIAKQAARMIAS